MTTLVSSIMSHMTVTKAGKEVASKNGPCVLLSYLGRKSYPETLQQNSPQISLVRTRSLAEGNRITPTGFIPWEKVFKSEDYLSKEEGSSSHGQWLLYS